MYFSLHTYCKYVKGLKNACIYNFSTGDIIELEQDYVLALDAADKPCSDTNMDVYVDLERFGLGSFYENRPYNPSMQYSARGLFKDAPLENNHISVLQLQLDNTCDLDCWFCLNENNYAVRQTGCYKWNVNPGIQIQVPDWCGVIEQGVLLSADTLFLTCDLSKSKETLIQVIACAAKNRYKSVYIYNSGYSITAKLLDDVMHAAGKCRINWNIQLVAHNDVLGMDLTGKADYYSKVFESIKTIKEAYGNFGLRVTCMIGNKNDTYIEQLIDSVKKISLVPQIDFIYPAPDHSNASNIYKNVLFDHRSRLEKIDCNKYSYYSEHHNCLGRTLAVFFDGSIAPCIMMRRYILDNVNKKRLSSILATETYKMYAGLSKDKIDNCKDCSYRYGCFDCRAIHSNNNIFSVNCNMNESM